MNSNITNANGRNTETKQEKNAAERHCDRLRPLRSAIFSRHPHSSSSVADGLAQIGQPMKLGSIQRPWNGEISGGRETKLKKKTRGLWALNWSPLTQIPLRCYVTAGRHGTKRLFSCSSSVVCLRRTDDRSGTAFYAGEKAVGTLFRGAKNNNNNNNN